MKQLIFAMAFYFKRFFCVPYPTHPAKFTFHCTTARDLSSFKVTRGIHIFCIHTIIKWWNCQRGIINSIHIVVKTRNQKCDVLEYKKQYTTQPCFFIAQ